MNLDISFSKKNVGIYFHLQLLQLNTRMCQKSRSVLPDAMVGFLKLREDNKKTTKGRAEVSTFVYDFQFIKTNLSLKKKK